MGIDDELLGGSFVEVFVGLGSLVQRNDLHIDGLRNLNPVVEDGHHQAAVVLHDRRLAGKERMRFGPSEAETKDEIAGLRVAVCGSRVLSDIQTWNPDRACRARCFHQLVQHDGRLILAPMSLRFKAHAIDGAIHFRRSEDLLDTLRDRPAARQINRFAPKRTSLCKTLLIEVGDDDDCGTQKKGGGCGGKPTGPAPEIRTVEPVVTPAVIHP